MKKYFITTLSVAFFVFTLFHSCQRQTTENNAQNTQKTPLDSLAKPALNYAKYTDSTIYPNGGSELSVLMREMYDNTDEIKKAISSKEFPPDFREKFRYLHKATPTDKDTKSATYPDMAESFEENLDKLYKEKDETKRVKQFNIVIQNCVNCHQSHCPGPIKKIKKLHITL